VKLRPWHFVLFLLLVAAAAIVAVFEFSRSSLQTPGELVAVLPHQNSIVFFINASLLRDAGVLSQFAGPKAGQEQDYQNFVTQSHFDYQRDLDRVAGTFNRGEVFLVIEGRFDWVRLREYAKKHGGGCANICWLPASTPGRWISFLPISPRIMGLAVSTNQKAVYSFGPVGTHRPKAEEVPAGLVWLVVPKAVLRNPPELPPSAQGFVSALGDAESLALSLASSPENGGTMQLNLDAVFDSSAKAAQIRSQLESATDLLKRTTADRRVEGDSALLAALLASGRFTATGGHVNGSWTARPELLNAILR
jgi:hypothetical protein